ncbi:hypothetical protein DPMN_037902 [Dreissena polymorpha]|uniref:Uncharacterized protein n=1 Tax=Dreissena polymorpha TaxID=45954 RepID=A0A9D4RMQ3_DREPO|nr:hypothetical protein DPMN_037902 [Dreissena polymorpha]
MCRHDNELYITSGTALYVYTLAGAYFKTIYEHKSEELSVAKCAVSLDGKRIYVTGVYSDGLITLSNDGTLLSTFTDPENME